MKQTPNLNQIIPKIYLLGFCNSFYFIGGYFLVPDLIEHSLLHSCIFEMPLCVDSPSFKRWKELGRQMLESGVRCFRRNLVTERSVLDLSFDPITVTREVSYATYVSQGNMRHKHFGTDHSKCFF